MILLQFPLSVHTVRPTTIIFNAVVSPPMDEIWAWRLFAQKRISEGEARGVLGDDIETMIADVKAVREAIDDDTSDLVKS